MRRCRVGGCDAECHADENQRQYESVTDEAPEEQPGDREAEQDANVALLDVEQRDALFFAQFVPFVRVACGG